MLLIEDDKMRQDGVSQLLIRYGYPHTAVSTIVEANDVLQNNGYASAIIASYQSGFLAQIAELRESSCEFLPVLLICDQLDDSLADQCNAAEIDGLLTRPLDALLLKSSLCSVLRMGQVRTYEREQRKQLLAHWQRIDLEHEVAVKIYNNVLCKNLLTTTAVKSVISPMALFNGDVLFVGKSPDDSLHLLLGDFTGHGLSSAVAALPTADMFYSMTKKGFSIKDILAEINSKLYKILPTNMFLAATAVSLYPDSKTLSLVTCGLPEHFLIDSRDASYRTIRSKNVPLGVIPNIEFEEQHYSVTGNHRLYLFTDGIFEAENPAGEAFGDARIIEAISGPKGGLDNLRIKLTEYSQELGQKDDISLVKLVCDVENVPWRTQDMDSLAQKLPPMRWKHSMEYEIEILKTMSPVPVMVNALMEIQGLQDHRQAIFMIVNELFANALDHGLLELDSRIKSTPEGFMEFYQLKEDRLRECSQGKIRFQFIHQPTDHGGRLIIKVTDSGQGFNWRQRTGQCLDENLGFSGRGLKMLETLCRSLAYHGRGNRVTAVFDWR